MIMMILALASATADPTPAQLYWQCRRSEKVCYDFLTEAAKTAPDLCLFGHPMWSAGQLEGAYTYGIERQPKRLQLSALDAAQQTFHDVMGCMDDHARQSQRDFDRGHGHP